ncbi:MAG TPA: hypothetical protein PLT57_12540, partial [Accumulibacter sp.]|nr:hypothetical protein [Accumulibacter sp.]
CTGLQIRVGRFDSGSRLQMNQVISTAPIALLTFWLPCGQNGTIRWRVLCAADGSKDCFDVAIAS